MRRVTVVLLGLFALACDGDSTGPVAVAPLSFAGGPPIKTQQCNVLPLAASFTLNDQLYVGNRTNIITGYTGLSTTGGAYLDGPPDTTIGGSTTQLSLVSKNYLAGMARDLTGRFYVAGANTNTVNVYAKPLLPQNNAAPIGALSAADGLSQPGGLAFDTLHNLLYVANTGNGTLTAHAVSGNVTFQPKGTLRGLSAPLGLALDAAGTRLYVANRGSNSIAFYDIGISVDGSNTPTFTLRTNVSLQDLTGPIGIALNPAGTKLYVANNGKVNGWYSVTIYDIVDGAPVSTPVHPVHHIGGDKTGLCNPASVAVDPAGSHLYVANRESSGGSIGIYNLDAPSGSLLDPPGEFNVQPAAFLLHKTLNQLGAPVGLIVGKANP